MVFIYLKVLLTVNLGSIYEVYFTLAFKVFSDAFVMQEIGILTIL